jgi:hypothetical protein
VLALLYVLEGPRSGGEQTPADDRES